MKLVKQNIALLFITFALLACSSDDTPINTAKITYSNPVEVTIAGYTDHAMEPFLSPDGQTLFYNSQNTGINTKLYYATRISDTEFEFKGEVNGANEPQSNQLNAVPDLDETNQFYWTSLREFPAKLDNLHFGTYSNGTVTNVGRVQGDFYVGDSNWLVMDHGISADGQTLFYNNGRFDNCGTIPCETFIGMAKKVSSGIFQKIANSDTILATINDPAYIYYAPSITKDNLELYYTRFKTGAVDENSLVEICVATRVNSDAPFGIPEVLISATVGEGIVEATTLTTDKQLMYYHKKINGFHKILMRSRE